MTDNTQLNDKISETLHGVETTIMQVRQINGETLTAIQGQLYTALEQASNAGNQDAMEAIEQSWIQVQQLHNAAISANDAAQTIADLARELQMQRNQVLGELKELTDDLDNMNLDNERIAEIYQAGCDDAFEDFDGLMTRCPGCDACENGHLPEVSHDAVNTVISALMGHWGDLSPKRTRQLTRFVNAFGYALLKDELEIPVFVTAGEDPDGWNDDEAFDEDGDDDE